MLWPPDRLLQACFGGLGGGGAACPLRHWPWGRFLGGWPTTPTAVATAATLIVVVVTPTIVVTRVPTPAISSFPPRQ